MAKRNMAKTLLYVFFSLLLLPGCSGAQKPKVQELASIRISPPTVIEHFAPLKEKKVYEFVQIDGERYGVPRPWRGQEVTEKSPDPSSLKQIPLEFAKDQTKLFLTEEARDAFVVMAEAASEEGIQLIAHSGYRSAWYQRKIFTKLMAEGRTWDDLVRYVAPPGYSEHMLGESVDLYPSNWRFASTEAYQWLRENGHLYNFHETYPQISDQGFPWEAWHWEYIAPKENGDQQILGETVIDDVEPKKKQ